MAETNGGVVVIKFKADTSELDAAKKNIGNFSKQQLAAERNELAKQRIELSKQRNLIADMNAQTKKYDAETKRIKVDNDKINQSVKNRLAAEKLNLQAQKQQNSMYKKINSSAGKLNTTIKAIGTQLLAFASIAAIANFAKACVSASSDVVEIENVVNNAFPNMTKQIDDWAENSVKQFGMAQSEAKKYASMFGMISRSAGLAEEDAFKLGTNLTALTADIGSMLNMKNEEVYTKLRSGVLSGETESIKQLGISMTETDVQAWLLSKGINDNYRQMTQAQKIAVRYNYVLEKSQLMQGDFAATQGTWANQSKQLSSNIKELQANLGTFLRTALLPLLTVLNKIIEAANNATIKFKEFLSTAFHINFDTSGISEGAEEIESGFGGIEESAEDAASAIKKTLGPLDQLNILGDKSGKTSGAGGGGSIMELGEVKSGDVGNDNNDGLNKKKEIFEQIAAKAREIRDAFKDGWDSTIDPTKWEKIGNSVQGIGNSLKDIFINKDVFAAADNFQIKLANSLGRISGNVTNVAGSIGYYTTESLNRALNDHKDEIQQTIIDVFDFQGKKAELVADFSDGISEVASVLEGEGAVRIGAAVDGIFISAGATATRLYERLSTDILAMFVEPLTENSDKIKENLDNIATTLAPVFESIEGFVTGAGQSLIDMYDEHIHPALMAISDFNSELAGFCQDMLKPFIDKYLKQISDWFVDFTNNKLTPLWNNIMDAIGKIADLIKPFLNFLLPILKILIGIIWAIISVILDILIPVIENIINVVTDVIDGIVTLIKGVIEIIEGIITGDFSKVIEGIVDIVGGVMESVAGVVDGVINTIIDAINNLFNTSFKHSNLVSWVKNLVSSLIGGDSKSESKSFSDSSTTHPVTSDSFARFANGGVFQPNNEILGILGDNKTEKEYALTESHLDMIARKTASILQSSGGGYSGTPNFNIQLAIDGDQLDARILNVTETNNFRG